MEQNDMFASLFSDPEKLQNAISMASSLLGGQAGGAEAPPSMPSAPPAEEPMPSVPPPPAAPAMSQSSAPPSGFNLGALSGLGGLGGAPGGSSGGYDPSAELMAKAMPVIQAITRTSQTAIKREKVNLLNSVKPFVAEDMSGHLDRAMRLVSMARVAKSALGLLGSKDVDDGTSEV